MVFKWEDISMYDLFQNNTPGAADKLDCFNWAGMITSFVSGNWCKMSNLKWVKIWWLPHVMRFCLFVFHQLKKLGSLCHFEWSNKRIDWLNYISLLTFDYGTINEKIRVNIVVMPSKGMSGHIDGSKKM